MDQQANMEELIHHFVSPCPEGEPCVLPMRSSSGRGGEGQRATPPWRTRDHANNRHLQLLITPAAEAEVRETRAALSPIIATVQNTDASVMVLQRRRDF